MNRRVYSFFCHVKVYAGIGITMACFLLIALHIFVKGISGLNIDFLFTIGRRAGDSLLPPLITTLVVIVLTLLVAVPLGVGSAIYINEYAAPGSRVVGLIRTTTESLAGIPSIVFGLFGFLFFVLFLGWSWSVMAGVCTLSIMILPTVMRSTEEALRAVPDGYREASFALGAGKLRTIIKVVLPSSISGILTAVILSVGRIVGESAALVLTAGTVVRIPTGLMGSASTLSVFMYTLTAEGSDFSKAYATAIVLMLMVFCINLLAGRLARKLGRG